MIKKLKLRFIVAALTAFTIVLLMLIVFVNGLIIFSTYSKIESKLTDIAYKEYSPSDTLKDLFFTFQNNNEYGDIYIKEIYNRKDGVSYFEIRPVNYFSKESVNYLFSKIGKKPYGIIENFRYKVFDIDDNIQVTVFIDVRKDMEMLKNFELYSIGGFIVCEIIVLGLLIVFSNKAVYPVVQNIKNQKDFIDNASHELKTPISIIGANNEIIEMKLEQSRWTQSTKRQLDRMNHLINQMLRLSEYNEKSEKAISAENVDIAKIAREIFHDSQSIILSKNIKLTMPESELYFYMDPLMAKDLMGIIIDNAIKYCTEGGKILIEISEKTFKISNSSPEMTKENVSNIFEKFYRTDKARSRETGGNGMGLAIAKSITDISNISLAANYSSGFFTMKISKLK